MKRTALVLAGRFLAAVGGVILLYVLAAVAGALIPRNPGWEEPAEGVEIFIRTNGVHAELALPAQSGEIDWYHLLPPDHLRVPDREEGWIAIGWGQRDFYLETRNWDDLTVRSAVRALAGGDTLMRVAHLPQPQPSSRYRPLQISEEAYRKLSAAIEDSFTRGDNGEVIVLLGTGYGDHDVFYEAEGTYHPLRTSNQWTADMLDAAGVTVSVWTPFEQGLMWRFQ